jgi:C4-dicarboxylate-specific signal transduction histidine kinase
LKILNRQPIHRQFVWAVCVLLAPLLVAVAWSANQTRLEQQAEVQEFAASTVTAAATHLDEYFDALDAMAAAILRHPGVMALDPACCGKLFADVLARQPILTNAVIATTDGVVRASRLPLPASTNQIPQTMISEVVNRGRPAASDWFKGSVAGKPLVMFGYPIRDDHDTVVGVLGLSIDLSQLQRAFGQVPLPSGSVISLRDRTGLILARSVEPERFIGTTLDLGQAELRTAPRAALVTGADDVERIESIQAVRGGQWVLSVGVPRVVVRQRLEPLWRRNIIIITSAAAALLLIGVVVAWQTTLHLNRLRSAAEQIADGDLSPPPRIKSPNLELAQLQDAFIQMAQKLLATREALGRQVEQERKMNETLHSLQRQVVRQERLAAVGILVSGVAHELNNPLQAILGTVELLERQPGLPAEAFDELSFVKTQSGRAREIIRNLSRFSTQQGGPPSAVDLREVIAEVVQLRQRDLDSLGIALDLELTSARKVYVNFTEVEQVTLNFVINAQQSIESAGRAPGRILIRLRDMGKKVRVEVLDNGPGVDPRDEPKLFQPFFTTKPVGKGTGLGLSVSYGIIESHGGTIGYSNNEWGGATFFYELPAIESGNQTPHDQSPVLHRAV